MFVAHVHKFLYNCDIHASYNDVAREASIKLLPSYNMTPGPDFHNIAQDLYHVPWDAKITNVNAKISL